VAIAPQLNHLATMKLRISAGILFPLTLLLVSACNIIPPAQSDTTRYYLLSAPSLPAGGGAGAPHGLSLGIRSVEVAEYLHTPSIVVREGANELVSNEFDRWAEPLDAGISRLIRTNLVDAPNVGRVLVQPFSFEGDRDYDITVTVLRCEGVRSGFTRNTSHFSALVDITSRGPNPKVVAHLNYIAPDSKWDGHDYAQLAADLSEAVTGLARAIVAALPATPQM
jgi:uncharacterized protein